MGVLPSSEGRGAPAASGPSPRSADGPTAVRPVKGRFAPSPTGRMHGGNIFSALMAWLVARSQGGTMVLRIEDLDRDRSKPGFADQVQRDFERLGLTWDEGPFFQQDRDDAYREALEALRGEGLLYPCFCTRADLHTASAPHRGEKLVYPGTCRHLSAKERAARALERPAALRLEVPDRTIAFDDMIQGPYGQNLARDCGDYIVQRSDGLFAYQLACAVDDADQGITSVVRGMDLLMSTPQQIHLRHLLGDSGAGDVRYAHVPLMVGERDRRLSKRDRDASLDALLEAYGSPQGVLGHIAYVAGLQEADEPAVPEELLSRFRLESIADLFPDKEQILWR